MFEFELYNAPKLFVFHKNFSSWKYYLDFLRLSIFRAMSSRFQTSSAKSIHQSNPQFWYKSKFLIHNLNLQLFHANWLLQMLLTYIVFTVQFYCSEKNTGYLQRSKKIVVFFCVFLDLILHLTNVPLEDNYLLVVQTIELTFFKINSSCPSKELWFIWSKNFRNFLSSITSSEFEHSLV